MDELSQMDAELDALAEQQRGAMTNRPLPASFSIEAIHDEKKSKAAGKPVYVDVEMIEIQVGRDVIRHPVTEAEKRTYALQYTGWKKGESQEGIDGFPLSQWAQIPGKAVVKEFARYGIRSVEQLASLTDSTLQQIGPYMNLRQKARDWVADAQAKAPLAKLREENGELRSRVEALERMLNRQTSEIEAARQAGGALPPQAGLDPAIEALKAQVAALAASLSAQPPPMPKKRGRPPKAKTEPPPNGA